MTFDLKPINNTILMNLPERQYKFVLIFCKSGEVKIDIDNQFMKLLEVIFWQLHPNSIISL